MKPLVNNKKLRILMRFYWVFSWIMITKSTVYHLHQTYFKRFIMRSTNSWFEKNLIKMRLSMEMKYWKAKVLPSYSTWPLPFVSTDLKISSISFSEYRMPMAFRPSLISARSKNPDLSLSICLKRSISMAWFASLIFK